MTRVALVGASVVGASWSLVFARAGFEVVVYDLDPGSTPWRTSVHENQAAAMLQLLRT
ncbi:MAG: 3-hydroxyacyl-CoA dehydrogenase NAD-binding domain-containing protein [Roseiarcus sp.]